MKLVDKIYNRLLELDQHTIVDMINRSGSILGTNNMLLYGEKAKEYVERVEEQDGFYFTDYHHDDDFIMTEYRKGVYYCWSSNDIFNLDVFSFIKLLAFECIEQNRDFGCESIRVLLNNNYQFVPNFFVYKNPCLKKIEELLPLKDEKEILDFFDDITDNKIVKEGDFYILQLDDGREIWRSRDIRSLLTSQDWENLLTFMKSFPELIDDPDIKVLIEYRWNDHEEY